LKPTLYIIRGLPGSGKSTFACKTFPELNVFEADQFFGEDYNWNGDFISDAHNWCYFSVLNDLYNGKDVVVSNTFTTRKELERYFKIKEKLDIDIVIYEIKTQFESVHDVPERVLQRMKDRWYNFPSDFNFAEVVEVN